MDLTEYLNRDATALAALVATGEVTSTELLELARTRADHVDPQLNSIVLRMDETAEQQAAAGPNGSLAGVPFLLKDLKQDFRGFPTSAGSRAFAHTIATGHSTVVERFLNAGLVIFGKTNTPEFGSNGVTEPDLWGPTRNPWNTDHTPGGSSGGSAAAVAAGIVPAAGASDGGGSIRIPAACSGLFGLKPTRGLAAFGPETGEFMFGMGVNGCITRTVRDSAAIYDAISGPSRSSVYPTPVPHRSLTAQIATPPRRLRIGYSARSTINPAVHPEAVAALEDAAALLTELGHEVDEVAPPHDDAALARDFLTIWFAGMATNVEEARARCGARDADFEAATLVMAELGRAAGVVAAFTALARTNEHVLALERFHETYDYFLTPTLAEPPLRIGALSTPPPLHLAARTLAALRAGKVLARIGIIDEMIQRNLGWVPYTQLANLTGRPAMSVPLHWTADGLPLGVQFVGRLGSDGDLLALAATLEQARPWFHRYADIPL